MVNPKLNILVPKLLIPVAADAPVVAPVKFQVNLLTAQLSAIVGLVVITEAEQVPESALSVKLAGQIIVGAMLSVTVIV